MINAVFMLITGMPYVVLISVLIGVTNIIPFFGPFIGGIPQRSAASADQSNGRLDFYYFHHYSSTD